MIVKYKRTSLFTLSHLYHMLHILYIPVVAYILSLILLLGFFQSEAAKSALSIAADVSLGAAVLVSTLCLIYILKNI